MTRDARFWRNVTIIALIHVVLLVGLLWWSRSPRQEAKNIVWMEGGAGAAAGAESTAATPVTRPEMTPEATPEATVEQPTPEVRPTVKSEIEIPSPTLSATLHANSKTNTQIYSHFNRDPEANSQTHPAPDAEADAQTKAKAETNRDPEAKNKADSEPRKRTPPRKKRKRKRQLRKPRSPGRKAAKRKKTLRKNQPGRRPLQVAEKSPRQKGAAAPVARVPERAALRSSVGTATCCMTVSTANGCSRPPSCTAPSCPSSFASGSKRTGAFPITRLRNRPAIRSWTTQSRRRRPESNESIRCLRDWAMIIMM